MLEPKIKAKSQMAEKINKLFIREIDRMVRESNQIWESQGIKITKSPIGKMEFSLD